jgi:hypothetical protein
MPKESLQRRALGSEAATIAERANVTEQTLISFQKKPPLIYKEEVWRMYSKNKINRTLFEQLRSKGIQVYPPV